MWLQRMTWDNPRTEDDLGQSKHEYLSNIEEKSALDIITQVKALFQGARLHLLVSQIAM